MKRTAASMGLAARLNEKTGEMSYSFASNLRDALPNGSFIGFTGMPIKKTDANTRAAGEMQNDEFQMSNRLNFGFALLHSHFPRRWWAIRNASRSSPPISWRNSRSAWRRRGECRMTNAEC